ncbi:MAG TPA: class I SAM-dependent methyltransferase [Phycisphaerae bacterium]|nr:class I SAM-dependent methyltransferase [Phycisphaerae bacterium]
MRARLTPDNPFGFNRYGYAWEKIPLTSRRHLDFGCGTGRFPGKLRERGFDRLVGIDASGEAIREACRRFGDIEFVHQPRAIPLPLPDQSVDSITMLEVIEHVHEQAVLLEECRRVLGDDGVLIITVPGRHVFSFLDMGNLKFVVPRLHRWCYCLRHGRCEYDRRYIANEDGLIGDISAEKRWHEHFTKSNLERLLGEAGFRVVEYDGIGLFKRVLTLARMAFLWCRPVRGLLDRLIALDARCFSRADLFCVAVKSHRA